MQEYKSFKPQPIPIDEVLKDDFDSFTQGRHYKLCVEWELEPGCVAISNRGEFDGKSKHKIIMDDEQNLREKLAELSFALKGIEKDIKHQERDSKIKADELEIPPIVAQAKLLPPIQERPLQTLKGHIRMSERYPPEEIIFIEVENGDGVSVSKENLRSLIEKLEAIRG